MSISERSNSNSYTLHRDTQNLMFIILSEIEGEKVYSNLFYTFKTRSACPPPDSVYILIHLFTDNRERLKNAGIYKTDSSIASIHSNKHCFKSCISKSSRKCNRVAKQNQTPVRPFSKCSAICKNNVLLLTSILSVNPVNNLFSSSFKSKSGYFMLNHKR